MIINMSQRRQTITDLLANRRFRLTEPRQAVFEVLMDAGKPLSAAQIHTRLNHSRVNLVSVYRTVQLFVNLGILRAVDASAGSQRFELVEPYNEHHHHLICTRCGEIVELEGCLLTEKALDMISHRVRQDKQFEVTGHEVQILGRCGDCSIERQSVARAADIGNGGRRWAGRAAARKTVEANG
ncbi:Zinc-specific metallo-regulatory protein [Candidatus Methylomirabilis lanthanidiphila]|uniref:Zinc-specific metallo-regulatory protein n=1 Tax=Candidatus Methylomirabilis lanthanidiphila TaxID=2211376 RepID=A0A564ZHN4_9BACT|nr:transcriptional repressor [Candidatus Methylomirabilis lanthanidiphila]VUZ84636.1 Zinc-specific metallo-regulatory protein [Candidatus Methylomirabilis lanthanidiphila]